MVKTSEVFILEWDHLILLHFTVALFGKCRGHYRLKRRPSEKKLLFVLSRQEAIIPNFTGLSYRPVVVIADIDEVLGHFNALYWGKYYDNDYLTFPECPIWRMRGSLSTLLWGERDMLWATAFENNRSKQSDPYLMVTDSVNMDLIKRIWAELKEWKKHWI